MRRCKFTFVNFDEHNKCATPDVFPAVQLGVWLGEASLDIQIPSEPSV